MRPKNATERLAQRYIPKDATAIERPELSAVVYVRKLAGKFYAMAYRGTAAKPAWHYSFKDRARLDQYVADWFAGVAQSIESARARAAERSGFTTDLQVGDILHHSWGYDQTNCDYYKVIKRIGRRTIEIVEIGSKTVSGSEGHMSEMCVPDPDAVSDKPPMRKIVSRGGGVRIFDWGSYAHKWTGGANYSSWYH